MSMLTPPHLLDAPRWKGLRVGLLGGTFDPPHEGHVHISLAAMHALQLDAVWWLVSPQNPLKTHRPLPLTERMRLSRELITHPKIIVSDIESQMGTNITYDTVCKLKSNFSRTDFVWISGMDNALTLHLWNRWRELLGEICMVHLTRKPATSLIQSCPLRMTNQKHVVIDRGGRLPLTPGISYWMMQKKMVNMSSTEMREKTA
ncbi:MAG: nicotinate-nucleotide adenylyltransferase [Alphaproteobacteria bacterium]